MPSPRSALLPLAMLRTIERLEALLPENAALLSIVKRNLAWRLKVRPQDTRIVIVGDRTRDTTRDEGIL